MLHEDKLHHPVVNVWKTGMCAACPTRRKTRFRRKHKHTISKEEVVQQLVNFDAKGAETGTSLFQLFADGDFHDWSYRAILLQDDQWKMGLTKTLFTYFTEQYFQQPILDNVSPFNYFHEKDTKESLNVCVSVNFAICLFAYLYMYIYLETISTNIKHKS